MPKIVASSPWLRPSTHRSCSRQPGRLQIGNDEVHVWRAELATVEDDLGRLLSAAECSHAEGIVSRRKRDMWIRARGLLRVLLGSYLGADPSMLRFAIGEHGKPALVANAPDARRTEGSPSGPLTTLPRMTASLSFNLAHSGTLALYAFVRERAIGVDVELARRPIDVLAIASRAFGSDRAQYLQTLEPGVREREFLRAWVRHEAALKCVGSGIGTGEPDSSREDLWVAELDVGCRAAAAVALERPPGELCQWDWPPAHQCRSFDGSV
jgi:4'-phosphopantetheinyl transferase